MVSRMTLWKFESDHQDSRVDGEDVCKSLYVSTESSPTLRILWSPFIDQHSRIVHSTSFERPGAKDGALFS